METTHALTEHSRLDDGARDSLLLQQLYQLYTAERQLALDLSTLFHQSTSIPMRLDLSDRRRESTRQILRLERIIQMTTGNPASHVVAGMTTLRPSAIEPGGKDVSLEVPLRALRAAIHAYRGAMSTATGLGQASIGRLLAESLGEKTDTLEALSAREDERRS